MFRRFWIVLLVAFAGVATATPVLNVDLNLCNPYLCAIDGIDMGTVVVKVVAEESATGIDFTVTTQDPGWLLWDGGLFGFNATAGGALILPEGFTDGGKGNEDGFGKFQYTINGSTQGGLASAGVTSLSFSVTGLQLSDIIANNEGHRFAAHVGVPGGTCGGAPCLSPTGEPLLTGFVTDGAPVPEPGTLGLLGGALIGLGCIFRRRFK